MNSLITDLCKYNITVLIPCYWVESEIHATIEKHPARKLDPGIAVRGGNRVTVYITNDELE